MKRNSCVHILAVAMLLAAAALVTPEATFAASSDNAASGVQITIDNFSFTPATVTVKAGTAVTWQNRDDIPHTVVSTDNLFKSKPLDTDDRFSFTPTKPGTYTYFCSIHPKMTATLVVQ